MGVPPGEKDESHPRSPVREHHHLVHRARRGECVASDGGRGRFWHTNHPLASRDLDPADDDPAGTADSRHRLARLAETGPDIESTDDCERLLADKRAPLCVAPEAEHNWLTFGSIAMELSSPPSVRIAPGPPDRTAWIDAPPTA